MTGGPFAAAWRQPPGAAERPPSARAWRRRAHEHLPAETRQRGRPGGRGLLHLRGRCNAVSSRSSTRRGDEAARRPVRTMRAPCPSSHTDDTTAASAGRRRRRAAPGAGSAGFLGGEGGGGLARRRYEDLQPAAVEWVTRATGRRGPCNGWGVYFETGETGPRPLGEQVPLPVDGCKPFRQQRRLPSRLARKAPPGLGPWGARGPLGGYDDDATKGPRAGRRCIRRQPLSLMAGVLARLTRLAALRSRLAGGQTTGAKGRPQSRGRPATGPQGRPRERWKTSSDAGARSAAPCRGAVWGSGPGWTTCRGSWAGHPGKASGEEPSEEAIGGSHRGGAVGEGRRRGDDGERLSAATLTLGCDCDYK